jgi:hypothetical protein
MKPSRFGITNSYAYGSDAMNAFKISMSGHTTHKAIVGTLFRFFPTVESLLFSWMRSVIICIRDVEPNYPSIFP